MIEVTVAYPAGQGRTFNMGIHRLHRRRLQSGDEYQRRQLLLHDAAGNSTDEEAKFGARRKHLGRTRRST